MGFQYSAPSSSKRVDGGGSGSTQVRPILASGARSRRWRSAATFPVTKSARALGHAPVGGPGGSLAAFAERLPRASNCNVYFAHLNNTNPLLDETSDAAAQLGRAGFALAEDGLEFRL